MVLLFLFECFETPERTWRFVLYILTLIYDTLFILSKNVEQMDKWLGFVRGAITSLHCGWVRKQGNKNRSSWKKRVNF